MRQAEQQLIAANANIGGARRLLPAHHADRQRRRRQRPPERPVRRATRPGAAPQLIQPLFDAGRNQGNLDLAKANRDIAVAQYERSIQSAFREVADALAGRATLGDQLNAQRKQLEAEQARSRLVELRWRNGAASSLELLDAQRSLFAAQQALLQLQAQSAQNLATLYKVLGGGWK